MNEEKIKRILLILFITIILGGTIWAIISMTYSPIKNLRNNTPNEANAYIDTTKANINTNNNANTDNNILSNIDATIDQNTEEINTTTTQETEISKYSTTIYDTEEARIHNIKLAISKLDNVTIKAGEEFSFNNTIGAMGEKQGYKKATGFDGNGKKIKIYGGGMCQISSTLYNAALIANFEITERHAHSRRVYYVPKDKDATVSYGGADLKFKNNKNNDVKILATTDGHEVTIRLIEIAKVID